MFKWDLGGGFKDSFNFPPQTLGEMIEEKMTNIFRGLNHHLDNPESFIIPYFRPVMSWEVPGDIGGVEGKTSLSWWLSMFERPRR